MVLGKKVAIFDWESGRNLAPREGQKIPWHFLLSSEDGRKVQLVIQEINRSHASIFCL